jgi:hypothetical protein
MWCRRAKPLSVLNSSKHASCRHPFWCDRLRTIGLISTITIIVLHSFRCIIGVGGGDGWGWGVHSRRWLSFGIGGVILMHLLFLIRVTEDDDVAVTGWPNKPTFEVTEELFGELLIP